MEPRKYRGYAQSTGFNPIRVPDTVSRIAAEGERTLRGMQQTQQLQSENQSRFISGLERTQQVEARNRTDLFDFQTRQNERVQQDELRNIQRQQGLEQTVNINDLNALAAFSQTIAKTVGDIGKERAENQMWDEYAKTYEYGLPVERIQAQEQAYQTLAATDQRIQATADQMQANGAPAEAVVSLRKVSGWRAVGQAKALTEMAATHYGPWLEKQFAENNTTVVQVGNESFTPVQAGNDPGRRAAATTILWKNYLQANGMVGMKPELLAPAFQQMKRAEQQMMAETRLSYAIASSDQLLEEAKAASVPLLRENPGLAFNELVAANARSLDSRGNAMGFKTGREKALEFLRQGIDTGHIQTEAIYAIEQSFTPHQPTKTWGELYPFEFAKLKEEIDNNYIEDTRRQDAVLKQDGKLWTDRVMPELAKNPPSKETVEQLIKHSLDTFGEVDPRLQTYANNYTQEKIASDTLNKEFEALASSNRLTPELVNDPRVPWDVRQQWGGVARQQAEARNQTGDFKAANQAIESAVLAAAKYNSATGAPKHYTIPLATSEAKARFNNIVSALLKSGKMDASEASQEALRQVITDIGDGTKGRFAYSVKDERGFINFGFDGYGTSRETVKQAGIHMAAVSSKVKSRGVASLDRDRLIPNSVLQEIDTNRQSSNLQPPPIAYHISDLFGGKVSPWEVLNRQLSAQGFEQLPIPEPLQKIETVISPNLRQLLQYRPSPSRTNRAFIGSGIAPQYIRQGTEGASDVIQLMTSIGFEQPALAAAQWALESGWGKARSGRNNVFGIKGDGSSVQTQEYMNGQMVTTNASFKNYNSNVESAKDYADFLRTSPRYRAVLTARTPREAAIAVAQAGYATDPAYADKLINTMRAIGVNPDVPYQRQRVAWRQPGSMRPKLVYRIDGIGPTSSGPHLDVKDTTGADFGRFDLDNYIEVEVGKRRLPLSTVITDDQKAHRRRGSHGIDFAYPKGTGVFLKNGAEVISSEQTEHGDKLIIQLPNGRIFSFLHGRKV